MQNDQQISENLSAEVDPCPSLPVLSEPAGSVEGANRHPNWGGRRPGAGAPKGDLNALKHGRSSKYQQRLIQNMLDIPELRDTLLALGKRQRHHRQRADGAAALLLASLFERAGEIVQDPEINQGQDNQELLQFLRTADGQLREILRQQASGRAKTILNQACSQTLTY